ncbi:MAG TPA: ATP synthase F1 subunit delta [Phycisphaerales bacterium]|nr:ATP synthase F1 subunit delta [Phycisphaerales bacterium]HRQ74589.1 ATP synthase F1 subunit delta [Phycisphaerales bacterium]
MTTKTDALAAVYAKSLLQLAEQAGGGEKITEVGVELEEICEIARRDRRFREFLVSPIIDSGRRGETLRKIFRDRVTDLTLRFMLVLNSKGRLGHIESIAAAYDALVQEAFGRIEVNIYTPAPLGEEQLQAIRSRIQAALGKEPVLHPYTDETMIGGIKLRIGDQLIDGSVANRLRRMKTGVLRSGGSAIRDRFGRMIDKAGGL